MKFEIYTDKAGEFRWRLLARNGKIIAESGEGYQKKTALKRAIKSIQEKAGGATILEAESSAS
jgi:uncharacterized protein YegP (UPF0339 family)